MNAKIELVLEVPSEAFAVDVAALCDALRRLAGDKGAALHVSNWNRSTVCENHVERTLPRLRSCPLGSVLRDSTRPGLKDS